MRLFRSDLRRNGLLWLLVGCVAVLFFSAESASARVPTPPHTVYGLLTVVNGSGTETRQLAADVGGVATSIAITTTGTVAVPYTMQLPADDPETADVEGGTIGDPIVFSASSGIVIPSQALSFVSGGRSRVDLSAENANAVTLDYFAATLEGDGNVVLSWATEVEVDHAGFFVYRLASDGAELRVTDQMIASRGVSGMGASYASVELDVPDGQWRYVLEDVDLANRRTRHAPVEVVVGVPTAVDFGRIQSASHDSHTPFAIFIVMLTVTGVGFGRKLTGRKNRDF